MSEVRFYLLGHFAAHRAGQPLPVPGGLAGALLKVLLVAGPGPVLAADLCAWLLPRVPARRARPQLAGAAETLAVFLAGAVPTARLEAGRAYRLTLHSDTWVDVVACREWAAAGRAYEAGGDLQRALACFQEAEALYLGDLLAAEPPAPWLDVVRERMRREYAGVLEAMGRCWQALGSEQMARGFAERARALSGDF